MKALITCLHLQRAFEAYRAGFEQAGVTPLLPKIAGQQLDAAAMRALFAEGVDIAIVGDDVIDRAALEAARAGGLTALIKWGIGTDGVDKAAAKALEIPVYNTPGAFGEEVADLAMTFLLLLARPLHRIDRAVREGEWLQLQGRSLAGLDAGVVGLGSIGQATLRRLNGFGMRLSGFDVRPPEPSALAGLDVRQLALDDLFAESDVVVLACALTPENRHMVNAARLARMRRGAYLINVARGPLVDEAALVAALKSGALGGAGLDVYEDEPLPTTSPLRQVDRVVLGSHCGSNTAEAVARINDKTARMAMQALGLAPYDPADFHRVA